MECSLVHQPGGCHGWIWHRIGSLNKVMLIGRLTRDPENSRTTASQVQSGELRLRGQQQEEEPVNRANGKTSDVYRCRRFQSWRDAANRPILSSDFSTRAIWPTSKDIWKLDQWNDRNGGRQRSKIEDRRQTRCSSCRTPKGEGGCVRTPRGVARQAAGRSAAWPSRRWTTIPAPTASTECRPACPRSDRRRGNSVLAAL